jgi:hypothetical protein
VPRPICCNTASVRSQLTHSTQPEYRPADAGRSF